MIAMLRGKLYLTGVAIVAGCTSCPMPTPEPPPAPPVATEAPKPPSTRQEIATVLRARLATLRQKEITAANRADDPDAIARVRELDKAADTALTKFARNPDSATIRTVNDARQRIAELDGFITDLLRTP